MGVGQICDTVVLHKGVDQVEGHVCAVNHLQGGRWREEEGGDKEAEVCLGKKEGRKKDGVVI